MTKRCTRSWADLWPRPSRACACERPYPGHRTGPACNLEFSEGA